MLFNRQLKCSIIGIFGGVTLIWQIAKLNVGMRTYAGIILGIIGCKKNQE